MSPPRKTKKDEEDNENEDNDNEEDEMETAPDALSKANAKKEEPDEESPLSNATDKPSSEEEGPEAMDTQEDREGQEQANLQEESVKNTTVAAAAAATDALEKSDREAASKTVSNVRKPRAFDLVCPHCNKKFSNGYSLRYHVDKFVCKNKNVSHLNESVLATSKSISETLKELTGEPQVAAFNLRKQFTAARELGNHVHNGGSRQEKSVQFAKSDKATAKAATEAHEAPGAVSEALKPKTVEAPAAVSEALKPKAVPATVVPSDGKCPHCNKVFMAVHSLRYHLDKFVCRPEAKPRKSLLDLKCKHCEKQFSTASALRYHVDKSVCKNEESQLDESVLATSKSIAEALKELNVQGRKSPSKLKCRHCGKKFTTASELRHHIENCGCQDAAMRGEATHKCRHCDNIFSAPSGLRYHLANSSCRQEELRLDESVMATSKSISEALKALEESQVPQYHCPHCDRSLANGNSLRCHVENYVCRPEHRPAGFARPTKPDKMPPGRPPKSDINPDTALRCPHCDRVFTGLGGLRYHVEKFVCRPELKPDGARKRAAKIGPLTGPSTLAGEESRLSGKTDDMDEQEGVLDVEEQESADDGVAGEAKDSAQVAKSRRLGRPKKNAGAEVSNLACPHCARKFTAVHGLRYHVDKFVCRPEIRPGGPVKRRGPTKKLAGTATLPLEKSAHDETSGEDSGTENRNKSLQDAASDLACPHCDRLFAVLGRKRYHVDNFVCRPELRPDGSIKRGRAKQHPSTQGENNVVEDVLVDEDDASLRIDNRHDGGDDDEEALTTKSTRRSPRKSRRKPERLLLTSSDLKCTHCDKVFSFAPGLRYHLGNFVCRPELRPEGSIKSRRKKPAAATKPTALQQNLSSIRTEAHEEDEHATLEIDETSDEDADGDSDEEETGRRSRKRLKTNTQAKAPLTAADLTCQHCDKLFSIVAGLRYHLDNFVCRPELRPGGPVNRGRRKREDDDLETSTQKKSYKRVRGQLEDRTCPTCKRVFTSVPGREYHMNNKVCQQDGKGNNQSSKKAFDTLKPGSKFVTTFGVVEVLADIRALPLAILQPNAKAKARRYQSFLMKRETQIHREWTNTATRNRAKRIRLRQCYEAGTLSQSSVFQTYFAGDPRNADPDQQPAVTITRPNRNDPLAPEGSFPERIVECVLLPDKRQHFAGCDLTAPLRQETEAITGTRLFLQRRLLTEMYNEGTSVHCCMSCGRSFSSRPGAKYHIQGDVCITRIEKAKAAREESLNMIEKRVRQVLENPCVFKELPPGRRKHAKKEDAVYPQAWLSLGFKAVARASKTVTLTARHVDHAKGGAESPARPVREATKQRRLDAKESATLDGDAVDENEPAFINPLDTLAKLNAELAYHQSQMLGPMYPQVRKALRFKSAKPYVPGKKKKKIRKASSSAAKKRKLERLPNPEAPIVDIRVLFTEVDSGRYPRFKRCEKGPDESGADKCYVCARGVRGKEVLLPCGLCLRSFHYNCMRSKYAFRYPEPGDDCMCGGCIGYILNQRNRAEKRRLDKLRQSSDGPVLSEHEAFLESMELTKGIVPGRELECVAAQARQVDDIVELLRDTKRRLQHSLEVARVNAISFDILASAEDQALL